MAYFVNASDCFYAFERLERTVDIVSMLIGGMSGNGITLDDVGTLLAEREPLLNPPERTTLAGHIWQFIADTAQSIFGTQPSEFEQRLLELYEVMQHVNEREPLLELTPRQVEILSDLPAFINPMLTHLPARVGQETVQAEIGKVTQLLESITLVAGRTDYPFPISDALNNAIAAEEALREFNRQSDVEVTKAAETMGREATYAARVA